MGSDSCFQGQVVTHFQLFCLSVKVPHIQHLQ